MVPTQLTTILRTLGSRVRYVSGALDGLVEPTIAAFARDTFPPMPGALLLCTKVMESPSQTEQLLSDARQAGAVAVIVKDPQEWALDRRESTGTLAVISVLPDIAWSTVWNSLIQVSNEMTRDAGLGERPFRDVIVTQSDTLAETLGGSVIIEDRDFQLLAYSRAAGEIDEARQRAILERRLPDDYLRAFNAQGVLSRLLGGEDIIRVKPVPEIGLGPRLVAAIRDEGELVGSIWLARAEAAFSKNDEEHLLAAARTVGPSLRRALNSRGLLAERMRQDTLALLRGDHPDLVTSRLSRLLGIPSSTPVHVLYCWVDIHGTDGDDVIRRLHLAVERAGQAMRAVVTSTVEGEVTKVLKIGCPNAGEECDNSAPLRFADLIRKELGDASLQVLIGVGEHQSSLFLAAESAGQAEKALAILRRYPRGVTATLQHVWADAALDEAVVLLSGSLSNWGDALNRLAGEDGRRGSEYVHTLDVALEHWGDVRTAAEHLHVHPNTVRYRLQRVCEIGQIDLSRSSERVVLQLQLRERRR